MVTEHKNEKVKSTHPNCLCNQTFFKDLWVNFHPCSLSVVITSKMERFLGIAWLIFTAILLPASSWNVRNFRLEKNTCHHRVANFVSNRKMHVLKSAREQVDAGSYDFPENMGQEWELDCYSRPVMGDDGKKLWELLITDSSSNFRYLKPVPSNMVNSRNVRKIVEDLLEASPVRPKIIRFFRNQMFNMITIALKPLDVDVVPSRVTHNLFMWLDEREKNVYPRMKGYNAELKQQTILDFEISQPERLPDVFKAESYAFVTLPAETFWNGEVNAGNINRGKLNPFTDMPKTGWVHGITLMSKRADSVAAWMEGLEIASVRADLLGRQLLLNVDLNTQFLIAPLMDAQKKESQIFEKGKNNLLGYHFLSVQFGPESDGVEGFWLLRQFSDSL